MLDGGVNLIQRTLKTIGLISSEIFSYLFGIFSDFNVK